MRSTVKTASLKRVESTEFAVVFVLFSATAGYSIDKLRYFLLNSESRDYERDEYQMTKIRHEADL